MDHWKRGAPEEAGAFKSSHPPKPSAKELKRLRVRRHFLDAAKTLILTDGLDQLSTKRIGEMAGYSYATIYNYFENYNELVCEAVEELALECGEFVTESLADFPRGAVKDRVLELARLMVLWNTENVNRYYPFLSTQVDFSYFFARDGEHFFHPAYRLLLEELSRLDLETLEMSQEDLATLTDILAYVFHSKLHFFIRYGVPRTQVELLDEVCREVSFLLGRLG